MSLLRTPLAPPVLPAYAIETKGLSKTYPHTLLPSLNEVSLSIARGTIFGLLGPNGAGKSTFIKILCGLCLKSEGEVVIWGHDADQNPRAARAALGVVPQELALDPFFSARETLEYQAGLYGIPRRARITDELLQTVGLLEEAERDLRGFSGGMKRRLMIAKALAHRPPVLVLDEPTAGVDLEMRHALWDTVLRLKQAGVTILLTTHYLDEAEALSDRIAILNEGRLVANDSKDALLHRIDSKRLTVTVSRDLREIPANLVSHGWRKTGPRQMMLDYKASQGTIGQILLTVQVNGLMIVDLVSHEPSLEDVFVELTQPTPNPKAA